MTKFPPDKHVRIHRLQVELFRPAPKRNLLMFYFTCSPEHTTFLFFTGLSNKDKYTLSMVSLLKQSSQKVKGYYTPRFFATDSLAVKLSCTYLSLVFSERQRPWALINVSETPLFAACVTPQLHTQCTQAYCYHIQPKPKRSREVLLSKYKIIVCLLH